VTFVALLVMGAAWIWINRVSEEAMAALGEAQPAVNHLAPALTLPNLDGEMVALADLRGQPVIVNFWATWCGPCREEMPVLEETARRYQGQLTILGVDQGEDAATIQSFLDEIGGVTFPILLDEDMALSREYNVRGLPTTFFIDAQGVIRQIYPGQLNAALLLEGIRTIR
jgi:thiol-disulfide isomerase/thioredoxin